MTTWESFCMTSFRYKFIFILSCLALGSVLFSLPSLLHVSLLLLKTTSSYQKAGVGMMLKAAVSQVAASTLQNFVYIGKMHK